MNFDMNLGSLSLIIFEGSPNQGKICWRNSSATPSAVMVSLQGICYETSIFISFLDYWQVTLIWSPDGDASLIRSFTYW